MTGDLVASQIITHAEHIGTVRLRFTAVRDASAAIAHDVGAYGLLCRWITETFQARHDRQDELVDHVDENLRLIGEALHEPRRPAEFDPVRLAAVPTLVEPVRTTDRLGWTMEHVESLRDVLDQLTGQPDTIAAHASTWNNIAVELRSMAEDLEDFVAGDTPDWHGAEADEHRRLMGYNVEAVHGLSSVSAALAEITGSAGVLVTQTRRIVRGFVMDLISLVAPPSTATPLTDGTFARWACRIAVYAVALDITLTHLENWLNG